jgi:hypothetical protein
MERGIRGGARVLMIVCLAGRGQADQGHTAQEEAYAFIAKLGVYSEWYVDPAAGQRAVALGVDEMKLLRWIQAIAPDCPAKLKVGARDPAALKREMAVATLFRLVGEMGTHQAVAQLERLDDCRLSGASRARERILARDMSELLRTKTCRPPSPDEVEESQRALSDFVTLRVRRGVLVATAPTDSELEDLAYLMAAVEGAGPEVGAADEGARWNQPGKPDSRREQAYTELQAAKQKGDLAATEGHARAYLETLGFPAPLRGDEEERFTWAAPRYYYVMRNLADAWEKMGRFEEAAALWRRASKAGGACGTGWYYTWQEQVRAVIRNEELAGRCRAAVPERLLAVDAPDFGSNSVHGVERLRAAGFDVPRLLRGALVTLNRDARRATVETALAAAPAPLGPAALDRLRRQGPEDWERRTSALRGLADEARDASIPDLLHALDTGFPAVRERALRALADLAERPTCNPCSPGCVSLGGFEMGSEWRRPVRPLRGSCATNLKPARRDAIAKRVLPFLRDRDVEVRAAAAEALGRIGSPVAIRPLRGLLSDPGTTGETCSPAPAGRPERCKPIYIVREAARQALDAIAHISAGD